MKYVQPYGISDPNAPYINGDPSIARMGSIPPAEAFEHPMREIVATISYSNEVPSGDDLEQLSKGIRSQYMNYCVDTGSINTLSVALLPSLLTYTVGLPLRVKVRNTNTGPTTIDAGAGRVPVRLPNGAEVAANDLPAAGLVDLVYDGTVFQMINFAGAAAPSGPPQTFYYNIPYTVDTSPTANTVIANFSPAITSYAAGLIFLVKIANTNTLLANINVNGMGLKAIYSQGYNATFPLLPGDIQAGDTIIFVYDGTQFWVYPNVAINLNSTINVSTIAQINTLFAALGRKRISQSAQLTIQLAAGVYNFGGTPFRTYHADATQIWLVGTMQSPGVPGPGNFQSNGNSAAQRAADSAQNIVMLRARYKTELRFDNTNGWCILHTGPGRINFKNLLITGANVPVSSSQAIDLISADVGSSIYCEGVTCWGSGENAFAPNGSVMWCHNCHAANNYGNGFDVAAQATLTMAVGGSYGNAGTGIQSSSNGMVWATPDPGGAYGPYCTSNANGGCVAQAATLDAIAVTAVGNGIDLYALDGGVLTNDGTLANTVSPDYNTVGNNNAIIILD
jgi:hypothetical protein